MNLNINHIISFCKGIFHGNLTEFTVSHISIDSRSLQNGNNTLFFAIKGQNHDAHLYLEELIAKGVRYLSESAYITGQSLNINGGLYMI